MAEQQPSKRKRTLLNLGKRVEVVKRSKSGESAISIAKSLGVGKTQVQNIIKEKESVLARWEQGESGDRKHTKQRKCQYTVTQ